MDTPVTREEPSVPAQTGRPVAAGDAGAEPVGPVAVDGRFARVPPAVETHRVVAAAGLVAVLAGVAAQNPTFVLCGLVMAATAILMRWLSGDLALPAAVLTLLTCATLAGLAADALGLNLLAWPWLLAALYLAFGALALATTFRTRRVLLTRPSSPRGAGAVAYLFAALAAGVGLAQAFDERVPVSWALGGTDVAQHMIFVERVQNSGALDYSSEGYPRAFHMLLALVSVPGLPPHGSVALLGYDLRLVAATTWLALALLITTGVSMTLRLGAAFGVRPPVSSSAAALLAAAFPLTGAFMAVFVSLGAAASLLAVTVLWALPLTAVGLRDRGHLLVGLPIVAATGLMLLANLWQSLAIVPLVAFAACAFTRGVVSWPRPALLRGRSSVALVLAIFAWFLIMVAAASVPVLGIMRAGGVTLAATPGDVPKIPWALPALGLLTIAYPLGRWSQAWVRLTAGSALGLLIVAAVMVLGAGKGFDLSQYYPMKAFWFLAIYLAPALALAVTALAFIAVGWGWQRLGRLGRSVRLVRFAACACLVAYLFAFWGPRLSDAALAPLGALNRSPRPHLGQNREPDGAGGVGPFDVAAIYGSRYGSSVTVPVAVGSSLLLDPYGTKVVSRLISFRTGQPQNQGDPRHVCSDVALVAGAARAVVVTKLDARLLHRFMARQGCGHVPVVQIPGGIRESQFFTG